MKARKQIGQSLPPVRGCVRLWRRGALKAAWATTGCVRPMWAEVDEDVSWEYLQRGNSVGGGTGGGFRRKIRRFRPAKKVQDNGRWSQGVHLPVTATRNVGPCQRLAGFPLSAGLGGRFRGFSKSRWSVWQESQRFQMLHCVGPEPIFSPSENINVASLYQRKEPGEIAAR